MRRSPHVLPEIPQAKPFRSRGHEATLALLRTANIVRRRVNAALEPYGLSHEQYNVLRILRGAGAEGLPTLDVAERMVEPAATAITRLMDKLEIKGLVRRKRCREDRRQVICYLTGQGLLLLAELDAPVCAADDANLAMLDNQEMRQLLKLLARVREG